MGFGGGGPSTSDQIAVEKTKANEARRNQEQQFRLQEKLERQRRAEEELLAKKQLKEEEKAKASKEREFQDTLERLKREAIARTEKEEPNTVLGLLRSDPTDVDTRI